MRHGGDGRHDPAPASGNAHARAVAAFETRYGEGPQLVVRAPGRVNLIGEHTDYNDGFVLPMALEHATYLAVRPRADRVVHAASEGYGDATFSLDDLVRGEGWAEYVKGIAWVLAADRELVGWEGTLATDIPEGASLSSSAALEVGTALVFVALGEGRWDPVAAARAAQRAENEWVGVPVGIMDQLISATATAGHAKLIDCRSLELTDHALPSGVSVVVLDTSSRRELVHSAYADRRATCEAAAAALGVPSLRDVTTAMLDDGSPALTEVQARRARHVVEENERVLAAVEAMATGDSTRLGDLMNASHDSLRDLYEVSGPQLDTMVDLARAAPGCMGARMTGGGFAGCAVALVVAGSVDDFIADVGPRYADAAGLEGEYYTSLPGAGASVV